VHQSEGLIFFVSDCVIEGLDSHVFSLLCWKGCLLCFLFIRIEVFCAWFVLLIWCVLLCRIYLVKWNHPFYWCYGMVKVYLQTTQVITKIHGGSIYIIFRSALLIYINIRTLPLKYKVVGPPATIQGHDTNSRVELTQPLHFHESPKKWIICLMLDLVSSYLPQEECAYIWPYWPRKGSNCGHTLIGNVGF
jgi:hypothetical protein